MKSGGGSLHKTTTPRLVSRLCCRHHYVEPLSAQALAILTVAVFADRPSFKSLCNFQVTTAPITMENCATPSLVKDQGLRLFGLIAARLVP